MTLWCLRFPISGESEENGAYLSTLPIEQFGALATATDPEELSKITDNYALSSLKVKSENSGRPSTKTQIIS